MTDSSDQIHHRITFRPSVLPDDEPFLQKLYSSTRDDLHQLVADESQLRELLLIQYKGQKATYAAEFPNASYNIILLDGEPAGRLIVDRRPDAIHGVDMALMPDARRIGIGSCILKRLFEECAGRNVPFVFHVLKTNPARKLYERLGCSVVGDNVTHFYMEWRPETHTTTL